MMDPASTEATDTRGHRLLQLGMLLFLAGLLTGFLIPVLANPRMGLASHLEGVMNGMLLVLLGLLWPRLRLGPAARSATFVLALLGTGANWGTTLLAAVWGAGASMMPIAAPGHLGAAWQETVISALLAVVSVAIVAAVVLVIYGLRMPGKRI